MKEYFECIEKDVKQAYKVAERCRNKGFDPESTVEIPLAKDMAERVVGLISVIAPQIKDTKIVERINELEKKYAAQDWRVALAIALEVTEEKFCKFKDKHEAMEVGIRVGIAYITNGVVSSPIEGFTNLKIRKRRDGKEYFALFFSGPIRSAGGTGASVSVLIGDYIRMKMGYEKYDPSEEEINRMVTEIYDYHEKVTNLQYLPSEEEIKFIIKHLPVQIDGDPSEKYDVSNYKGLERIETDKIRNGPCLVIGEGICQKATKLSKNLSKWGKDFDLSYWNFLDDFLRLQKKIKSRIEGDKDKKEEKIKPDFTFIKDLVAGRPVFTYPLTKGGFRLRYGRGRNSGFSSQAINPITMYILNKFLAIGTQLKVERPGKSTVLGCCDVIEGPIVKLNSGDVLFPETVEEARNIAKDVMEILFLGDILINYGDFLNRNHTLVPAGYCEEWWAQELKEAVSKHKENLEKKELELLNNFINNPLHVKPDAKKAIAISLKFKIPLHPRYVYRWDEINKEQLIILLEWYKRATFDDGNIILPLVIKDITNKDSKNPKRILELLGVPHKCVLNENVVIQNDWAIILRFCLENVDLAKNNTYDIISSKIVVRDKSGTYIGARMGRPEKAKMRKLTGAPQVLFPVGNEGGRLRSFQEAIKTGYVNAQFPLFFCNSCNRDTIYPICENCESKCQLLYKCVRCGKINNFKCHDVAVNYAQKKIDIKHFFTNAAKKIRDYPIPELIKGVRGTSNRDHTPENLVKGLLRAVNNVYVNKDGTIRYDMTEMPLTHFKPKEIGTSISRLRELGYAKDIYGNELKDEDQILELKVQDVILPDPDESLEEGAKDVLFKIANFVDELLTHFYGENKFYNFKNKDDIIGHYIVGLAPHISAGMVGRVIGFSKTQGFLAHPCFHSALRRDCFGHSTFIPLCENGLWKIVKLGDFVETLSPNKVIDDFGTLAKSVDNIYTVGYNPSTCKTEVVRVNEFTKHTPSNMIEIETQDGRKLKITEDHKFCVVKSDKVIKVCASDLNIGDKLIVPFNYNLNEIDIPSINLESYYGNKDYIFVRNVKNFVQSLINKTGLPSILHKLNITRRAVYNYIVRDSFPISFMYNLLLLNNLAHDELPHNRFIGIKRDSIDIPYKIPLNEDVLHIIGLYVAEGFSRKKTDQKGYYQVDFAASEEEIRGRIKYTMNKYFNLAPSYINKDRLTYSSHILHDFFVEVLRAGHDAHSKRIPSIILNLPKEKLKHFLMGYFDGDGSDSLSDLRICCDSVSIGLINDLEFVLRRYGIFAKRVHYKKKPGPKVRQFYIKKNREIPEFEIDRLVIPSNFCKLFLDKIGFKLSRKQKILIELVSKVKPLGMRIENKGDFAFPIVKSIKPCGKEVSYCLNVHNHIVVANGLMTYNCDGDEAGIMLLMDMLLNFSRKYLPNHRGATQDAPLVLTSIIIPKEVDDMVFDMDIAWQYPLDFYYATLEYKMPSEVKVEKLRDYLGTEKELVGYGFTHNTDDINGGVKCSSYKSLPTMEEKVLGQMDLANKIRAVDKMDVARLVIERHFIRDIKGNLRKFSMQQFRCVKCNEKFRRPPLLGACTRCGGNIIFTVSEGSIIKYLEPSLSLAKKYDLSEYLKQTLEITKRRIESVFGKEPDKQEGLGKWF